MKYCQVTFGVIVKEGSFLSCNEKSKLYKGVPEIFEATRYHSLIIDKDFIPEKIIINSWLEDGSVMGVEHYRYPLYGVQYHPESIKTKYGKTII